MITLRFSPVDTLFFRDGRPFNQGEGNAGIESVFPPSPDTFVGAARAAWAKALGWPGRGEWPDDIRATLGGDGDELDGLAFCGPLLYYKDQPVYPAPALLIGKTAAKDQPPQEVIRLRPADLPTHCDLGKIQLPVPEVADDTQGRKLLEGWWITAGGMNRVLAGQIPQEDDWIPQDRLWRLEPRVGIGIDPDKGTVNESMLYSIQHVRLENGITLAMGLEGTIDDFPDSAQIPLGGESRSAWMEKTDEPALHGLQAELKPQGGTLRYAVHVLTPLGTDEPPEANLRFCGLPGKLVSACLPRAQRWGGWNSVKFEPKDMKPHLPPGSVLFMEAPASDIAAVNDIHGKCIGQRASWGYGLIAVGHWN